MAIPSAVVNLAVHWEEHALRGRNHTVITVTTPSNAHRGAAWTTNVKNISTNALLNAIPTRTALIQDPVAQMDTVAQQICANKD